MPSIARLQENGITRLNWFTTYDYVLHDAYAVEFAIYDIVDGAPGSQIFPDSGWEDVSSLPGHFATGSYYAYDNDNAEGWTPPITTRLGEHRIYWRWKMQASDDYQQGTEDFEVTEEAVTTEADFLTITDLYNLVGSERVIQLLDDQMIGGLGSTNDKLQSVLISAEGEAYSRMLRSWSKASVEALAGADAAFKMHCAWVALELACERRPAFCAEDGKGAYWAQYERAISHFERLSKTRLRSTGESAAGAGANLGGNLRPTTTAKKSYSFVFATSEKNPTGSGGY